MAGPRGGDATEELTAMVTEVRKIERLSPPGEPPWLYWVNQAEMTGEVGNALRQLGHTEQAAKVLENSVALLDDSLPRDRAGYLIHLAPRRR